MKALESGIVCLGVADLFLGQGDVRVEVEVEVAES
jgi:hypothetical protein